MTCQFRINRISLGIIKKGINLLNCFTLSETISSMSEHVQYRHDCPSCHHMMHISNVTEAFGGRYICRAVNSVGSGEQQFILKVNGGECFIIGLERGGVE